MTVTNTRSKLVAAKICEVAESGKETGGISVNCMFNPFEYTVSKSNTYSERPRNNSDVPNTEFEKAGAQTLRLSLTFDTYEADGDVAKITNQLWKLMETKTVKKSGSNEKIPPPQVAFEWGVFRFVSYITEMTQRFTLFKYDGTPVRAKVDVTFVQYLDLNDYPGQNPTSGGGPIEQIWQVTAGDRLDLIAQEVYGDSTKWRLIAEHNQIWNPALLRSGQQLAIPLD